ncbi:MAG: shikimate kinase [Cyanobacteria bacterium P01_H01_bin.130]
MSDPIPPQTTSQATAQNLRGLSLYLIGMMGVGKSTVGRAIAQSLKYRFFDTDDLIEQVANKSIPDIFASDGETAFRTLETQVLSQLSGQTRSVIATGGGIVTQQDNWRRLRNGAIIWLDAPVEVILQRLRANPEAVANRPLLQTKNPEETLTKLLNDRQPLYANADLRITIAAGDRPDAIVNQVLSGLRTILHPAIVGADNN